MQRWARRLYEAPKGRVGDGITDAGLRVVESVRCRRLLRGADTVYLVHTMGKVGSTSLCAAIDAAGYRPAFHTHVLVDRSTRRRGAPRRIWYTTNEVARARAAARPRRWVVVTVVRDLIDRNISSFFQNLDRFVEPRRIRDVATDVGAVDELIERFVAGFPHRRGLTWFDREIGRGFGIDVHRDPPTDTSGRWWRYEGQDVVLHVVRFDDLHVAHQLLAQDLPGMAPIPRKNASSAKVYGSVEREFRRRLRLPADLVTEIQAAPFSRRFFPDVSVDAALQRWAASGPPGKETSG